MTEFSQQTNNKTDSEGVTLSLSRWAPEYHVIDWLSWENTQKFELSFLIELVECMMELRE